MILECDGNNQRKLNSEKKAFRPSFLLQKKRGQKVTWWCYTVGISRSRWRDVIGSIVSDADSTEKRALARLLSLSLQAEASGGGQGVIHSLCLANRYTRMLEHSNLG